MDILESQFCAWEAESNLRVMQACDLLVLFAPKLMLGLKLWNILKLETTDLGGALLENDAI